MKLLIVEDDPEISSALRKALEEAGFFIEIIRDGDRALRAASSRSYAAILLDLMLPGIDGLEVCQSLREAKVMTPILIMTARDAVGDRIHGLETGADDYIGKPFDFDELLARIRALIRRDKVHRSNTITIGDLKIDVNARRATRSGRQLDLTHREYTLLECLAMREGHVVSRDTIRSDAWQDEFSLSNNVDATIKNLRKKLDASFETKLIHTIVREGYMLSLERSVRDDDSN